MSHRLLVLPLVVSVSLVFAVACGGGDGDGDDDPVPTATTAAAASTPTTAASTPTASTPAQSSTATAPAASGDPDAGEELAATNGCTGCHSTDGSVIVGPSWQGLYGSDVPLEDGSTVTADDAYITESIRDPGAKIHAGFENIMPTTFASLTDAQIADLIAYIRTLE